MNKGLIFARYIADKLWIHLCGCLAAGLHSCAVIPLHFPCFPPLALQRNYRTFLLFVYTTTVLCLYVMGCCLAQLFMVGGGGSEGAGLGPQIGETQQHRVLGRRRVLAVLRRGVMWILVHSRWLAGGKLMYVTAAAL